ncbi:MAG: class A beta-lactamase-related serine hydrolase [Bacteroidetes bacterium]|nr:MAG: class A beta-lactamase-related serine hydrolase [Bacteroidota bacterium]
MKYKSQIILSDDIKIQISAILGVLRQYRYILVFFLLLFSGNPLTKKNGYLFSPSPIHSSSHAGFFSTFYSEEEIEFLDHQITGLLVENNFNGNVLISRFGMLIYERSFGFACFRSAQPMNPETSFQLASISKTFTGTAILLLQQKGLLNIDDKVQKHIPEFPYDNITIRHMLNHTSGLQNYMWMIERHWRRAYKPNNEDVLQLFLTHRRPLNFPPGQRFEYSNTGYVFLALIIERVSGQSFAGFIHDHIFEPLEMNRSFVYDLHNPVEIENRAFGYRQWRGQHIIIPDDKLDGPLGDKGIFSTVGDLHKWDQAIHRSALLPSDLWKLAFEQGRLNNDSLINYGLGWRLQDYLDKKIVHHPGRWHGFRTSFKRFVDDHTTLILLSNNNRNIADIIEGIQDILYYDEKEIWIANRQEVKPENEMDEFDTGKGIEP